MSNITAPSNGTVFIDPVRAAESNLPRILGVTTAVHAVALIFVSLRMYARLFVVKSAGKDDICMVISALCALGGWIIFVIQSAHGLGRHQDTIPKPTMVTFQHAGFWQSVISATLALGFLKLSIGFNLLRLSTHKWYKFSLYGTMAIVVSYTIMGAMTFFFHCTPMAAHWDTSLVAKGAYCYPIGMFVTFALVNTSFNIATDVLFAAFPVPIIWTLQMKRRTRIYLIGILSLGYFAVVMGILKAVYQIAFSRDPDKTFNQWIQFWGFLQLNIGIIAACAATLKPLVNRVLKLGSTEQYYNSGSRYAYGTGRSRSRGGTLGTREAGRPRKLSDDEFEMGSGEGSGSGGDGKRASALHTGLAPVVRAGGSFYKADDGSSSEMILERGQDRKKGIVVATEVKVSVGDH
ncbi:hypothetical protein OQA88_13468 [Cercophora sp. LCS_1]